MFSWKSEKARPRRIAHACWLDTLRTYRLPTQGGGNGKSLNSLKDERQMRSSQ
jgi:hypothetical protein